MTDIARKKTTELTTDHAELFEQYGNAATARAVEGDLLKFVQGDYFAGQDNREVSLGTRLVPHMDSLAVGWLRWQDNAPVEERMGLVAEGFVPVRRHELGDNDKACWETDKEGRPRDPWQFSNRLVSHDPDNRKVYTFATSSKGGLGAIGELCKAYGKHIRQYPNEEPIIELAVNSYPHPDKSIGRVKVPVFEIVGWTKKGPYDDEPAPAAEPPKSPPSDKAAAAAAKPATAHRPTAQPHF